MMLLARFDTFHRNEEGGQTKFMFFLNHLKPLSLFKRKWFTCSVNTVCICFYIPLSVRSFCSVVALVFRVIVDGSFVRQIFFILNECSSFHSHGVPQGIFELYETSFQTHCLFKIRSKMVGNDFISLLLLLQPPCMNGMPPGLA